MFRYTMVSVISTAVSLSVLFLVFGVLQLWSEVPSTDLRQPGGDASRRTT